MKGSLRDSDVWRNDWFYRVSSSPAAYSFSGHERNHLFLSDKGRQFHDISGISGLDSPADGRSFVILDYDRDGRSDIAVVGSNRPLLSLYRNETRQFELDSPETSGRFLAIRFQGGNRTDQPTDTFSSRDGYGAIVRASVGDETWMREHRCGEGFAAQNSATLRLGIGPHDRVDQLEIVWPSGQRQQVSGVAADSLVTVYENPTDSPTGEAFVVTTYSPAKPVPTVDQPDDKPPIVRLDLTALPEVETAEPARLRLYTTMATWCSVCKQYAPELHRLRDVFDRGTLAMFGLPIDPDDRPEDLAAYVKRQAPAYRMISDLDAQTRRRVLAHLVDTLGTDAPPSTIVTDQQGGVLLTVGGVPTISDIYRLLAE